MAFTGPLADRIEIRELIATYANAVTRNNKDAYAACWAEDGVWSIPALPGMERIEGRDKILEIWVQAMALFPFQVMLAVPGETEVTGDTARGITYNFELNTTLSGVTQRWTNEYHDTYVKRDGRWQIKSRTLKVLHIGPHEPNTPYVGPADKG
jgi:uncharacterized protein (TIGR02246 family)